MARPDPKNHSKVLAGEAPVVRGQEVVQSIAPIEPEAALKIFRALKSFGTKFPAQAPELISRVGKMLGASDEEMAKRLKVRSRNDWKPNLKPQGTGGMLADAGSKTDRPVNVGRVLRRSVPEEWVPMRRGDSANHVRPARNTLSGKKVLNPPQGPNAARAAQAPIKAAEKIVDTVEQALKKLARK